MSVRRRQHRGPDGKPREAWVVDVDFERPDGTRLRIRKTSPVQTRRAAEEFERQLRTELLAGTYGKEEKQAPTLAEFAPRWVEGHLKANRRKHSYVTSTDSWLRNHLLPELGTKRLDLISAEDIARLKATMTKLSPNTVNNVLAILGRMLKAAVKWHALERLPVDIEMASRANTDPAFYDDDEYARLLEGAAKVSPLHVAAVRLGGDAGLRAGEICALEWPDIDFRRGILTVKRTEYRGVVGSPKGGRSRVIPMTVQLAAALQAARHLRGPRVLYREDGTTLSHKTLASWMKQAERRAGMEVTGRIHVLRHTFCARLAMRGAPAKAIQELAGHASLATTQRYMHLSPAARDGAIRMLERSGTITAHGPLAVGADEEKS